MKSPLALTSLGHGPNHRHLCSSLRKGLVLCCIVKPLGINLFREVVAFPGNRAPEGFGLIDMLAIAEFLADAVGIDHDILSWVEALPASLLRYSLRGQGDDAPTPLGGLRNLTL
jgi:hypothetical protein